MSDEERLFKELFEDYNPSARPVMNSSKTVSVAIMFSLLHIKELVSHLNVYLPNELNHICFWVVQVSSGITLVSPVRHFIGWGNYQRFRSTDLLGDTLLLSRLYHFNKGN